MTRYQSILIPVPAQERPGAAMGWGMMLAREHQAWAIGLHVRPDPTAALPLVGEGMSGAMVEEMLDSATRQADERAGQARQAFLSAATQHECGQIEWQDCCGREEDLIPHHARLADLLVLDRPGSTLDIAAMLTLNAALMESGCPVLLCPKGSQPALPRQVVVAWNGSLEASRTVRAAMPLLGTAQAVHILSSADQQGHHPTAAELALYLKRQGIAAQCQLLHGGHNLGSALLEQCQGLQADLLVMGAYSHSRLRQLILGGVTRHVLDHAAIPCLMGH